MEVALPRAVVARQAQIKLRFCDEHVGILTAVWLVARTAIRQGFMHHGGGGDNILVASATSTPAVSRKQPWLRRCVSRVTGQTVAVTNRSMRMSRRLRNVRDIRVAISAVDLRGPSWLIVTDITLSGRERWMFVWIQQGLASDLGGMRIVATGTAAGDLTAQV